jgi:phage protein D/phage baseplate assembly protein gpV
MPAQQISNSFVVEVDGKRLPADVDLASVTVEDHLHLPDAFSITFRDVARAAITKTGAKIGAPVKISVLSDADSTPQPLLEGEITALEAEIFAGASYTVVRGYDQSHRLFRGRATASYTNMTYSDVARKVAQRCSLKAGAIDSTTTTHDHITQSNETNWRFLSRLARDVGFEVAVSDGKLNFRKPATSSGAPGPSDLTADNALTLTVGSNLLSLRAVVTATDQVKEVEVRAWDPANKEAFKSTAPAKTELVQNALSPEKLAQTFPGNPLVSTGIPYSTAAEVESAAKALSLDVASSYTEIEGQARGNTKIRAGTAVTLGLAGEPFDGKYVVTCSTHTYDNEEGYVTNFVVSGRQPRSLLSLAGGSSDDASISGVVPAIVDDVDDPKKLGRVRVRFPWMDDVYVSDWARLVMYGAGKDRGWLVLPEVGDEVLVAFEQGDMRRPYIVGGLYNGKDTPNLGPGSLLDSSSKAVNNRLFTSRTGHQLIFVDGNTDPGVVLKTGDGKIEIRLDKSKTELAMTCSGDISLKADGNITIEAKRNLDLKGQSVAAEGQTNATVKAAQVSVEGSGLTAVKGQPLQLN